MNGVITIRVEIISFRGAESFFQLTIFNLGPSLTHSLERISSDK